MTREDLGVAEERPLTEIPDSTLLVIAAGWMVGLTDSGEAKCRHWRGEGMLAVEEGKGCFVRVSRKLRDTVQWSCELCSIVPYCIPLCCSINTQ